MLLRLCWVCMSYYVAHLLAGQGDADTQTSKRRQAASSTTLNASYCSFGRLPAAECLAQCQWLLHVNHDNPG